MPEFSTEFWVGTGVALFALVLGLAVTVAMDCKTRGEFRVAVSCFVLTALIVIYGIGAFVVSTQWPAKLRFPVAWILIAAILALTAEAIRWAHARHVTSVAHSGPAPVPASVPSSTFKEFRPLLAARPDFIWWGTTPELGGCQVFINVMVKNDGSPSIAHGWHLSVQSASVNINHESPTFIPDGLSLKNENAQTIAVFHANNRLEEKTYTNAIQQGIPVRGWLRFVLPRITNAQFDKAEKTLHFLDANDVEYSTKWIRLPELSKPQYYPGSGDNPFVIVPNKSKKP